MAHLLQVWLPILATAIGVFVASSLIHMVFKWHDSDYRPLSNESDVAAAIALQVYGLGGDHHTIAHLAALISLLTHAGGSIQQGIWMGKPWRAVAKDLLDALIYAVVTAFAFAALWPEAG
jgi:hypothetical protein